MSTRINTNVTAFAAARNLSTHSDALSKSISRLSSGLRVSSAADNAAGLVISQNMTAQLTGLDQASRNANDAINLVKTAEGSLNEVQNLLMTVRQLAVHAANAGVNSAADTAADQTQIASALSSIDRIAKTTSFGDKKLLDGSATSSLTHTAGTAKLSGTTNFGLVAQGSWNSATAASYTNNSLSQVTAATDTYATTNFAGVSPATLTAANTSFAGSVNINGATYAMAQGTPETLTEFNQSIVGSGYQAAFTGSGGLKFTSQTAGELSATPSIDLSKLTVMGAAPSTITTGVATGNAVTFDHTAGTGGYLPQADYGTITAATPIAVSGTLQLSDSDYPGVNFNKTYKPGTKLSDVQTDLDAAFGAGNMGVNSDLSGVLYFSEGDFGATVTSSSTDFVAYNTATIPTTATFMNGNDASLTIADSGGTHAMTSSHTVTEGGTSYYAFANGLVLSSQVAASSSGTTGLTGKLATTAGTSTHGAELQFHIGANTGENISTSIGSISTDQLGKSPADYLDASGKTQSAFGASLRDINVTSFKGAQDALAIVDKALTDISGQRANLGALQTNTLQSVINSLGIANQNLLSSRSTIVDTDLSSEIVSYTKEQILVQAGTSALGQANQANQMVMKLLQ